MRPPLQKNMFDDLEKKDNDAKEPADLPTDNILFLLNSHISEKKPEAPKTSVSHLDPIANFEERLKKLEARGRKRGRRFSIIGIVYSVIICIAILISGYYIVKDINDFSDQTQKIITEIAQNEQFSEHRLKIRSAWKTCETDIDCVETNRECCQCQAGGRQSAINKLYLPEWEKMAAEKCLDRDCAGQDNCASGAAVCEDNYCLFKEANADGGMNGSGCISEGQTWPAASAVAPDCCPGLRKIVPAGKLTVDGSCLLENDTFICLPCPNGICESLENDCNCPEDCAGHDRRGNFK
jgi:hypothetical protein